MAFPMVDTGYKPEFALGALYHGENAAASQAMQDEELIKSYLANQRERQMQPLDVDIKSLQAGQARTQNTPDMLKAFGQNAMAGYNKNIREDELGTLLQPFRKQAAPMQGQAEVAQATNNANLLELQKTIDTGMDRDNNPISPQDMQILQQELQKQIAMRGQTPELYGKMQIEDKKGQWDMDKQRLANEGHLRTAEATAAKAREDQLHKTYTAITSEVRTLTTEISRAESKELENQVLADLLSKKMEKSVAEKEAKRQVTEYQQSLRAKKAELENYQRFILQQIPGLSNMPVAPTGSAQAPIKLK